MTRRTDERTVTGVPRMAGGAPGSGCEIGPPHGWDRYHEVELIGAGGMGRVFRAWDPRLARHVALKFLAGSGGQGVRRFLREAQSQAQVNHPHVCEIFEAGEVEGRLYIAMQYLAGQPLSTLAGTLTRSERIEIVRDVARGVHAAHLKGLIHRDIKPSNIIVERRDDGTPLPRVVDFGLSRPFLQRVSRSGVAPVAADSNARDAESGYSDTGITLYGELAGTPSYMSPEQALGVTEQLDARTDVYALGATLYELLSGRPPHRATTTMELLLKVTSKEPEQLQAIDPSIPADLEAIVTRCLRKDPRERYHSAAALADELQAYLDGRPVRAHPRTAMYVARKVVRRQPTLTAAALALMATVVSVSGLWLRSEWLAAREIAVAQSFSQQAAHLGSVLWKARSLPVHDVRPTTARVRQQAQIMESRMDELGSAVAGPGQLVLGKIHLDLDEPEAAVEHLQQAWDGGYRIAETGYALGLALSRVYERSLARLATIADPEIRAAERHRLEVGYRDRASELLSLAGEAEGATQTTYVEGLLALFDGRIDDGLRLVEASLEDAPWEYDAMLLEGDLQRARLDELGLEPASEEVYRRALDAYRAAAQVAPSDPAPYQRQARLMWARLILRHVEREDVTIADVEQALAVAATAVEVDADHVDSLLSVAYLHDLASEVAKNRSGGTSAAARRHLDLACRAVNHAVEVAPTDPVALAGCGQVHTTAAKTAIIVGEDPLPDLEIAVSSLERAVAASPTELNHNALGVALRRLATWRMSHGLDADDQLERAEHSFRQAIALNPDAVNPRSNLGWVQLNRGQVAAKRGGDGAPMFEQAIVTYTMLVERSQARGGGLRGLAVPLNQLGMVQTALAEERARRSTTASANFDAAVVSFERAIEVYPGYVHAANNLGYALYAKAHYELDRGRNPAPLLSRAERALDLAAERPGYASPYFNRGLVAKLRARWQLLSGADPGADLAVAEAAFALGLELRPGVAAAIVDRAAVSVLRAQADLVAGRPPLPALELARSELERAMDIDPSLALAPALLSECWLIESRWRRGMGLDDTAELERSRELAARALDCNPSDREALRVTAAAALESARRHSQGATELAAAVATGRRAADRALEIAPYDAEIMALRAGLMATAARAPGAGGAAELSAAAADLRRALELNPLLAGSWGGEMEAIQADLEPSRALSGVD